MTTRATQVQVSPLAGKRHGKGRLRLKGMALEHPDLVRSAGTSRPHVSLPTGWPTRLRQTCRALLLAGLMGAALPASAATLRWAAQTEITSLMIFVRLQEFDYAAAAAIASVVLITSLVLLFGLQLLQNRLLRWQRGG